MKKVINWLFTDWNNEKVSFGMFLLSVVFLVLVFAIGFGW